MNHGNECAVRLLPRRLRGSVANAVADGARGESAEVRLRFARELVGIDVMARVPGSSGQCRTAEPAVRGPYGRRCRLGRCDRLGDADTLWRRRLQTEGLHRRARRAVATGKAEWQGRIGLQLNIRHAWRQSVDDPLALQPARASGPRDSTAGLCRIRRCSRLAHPYGATAVVDGHDGWRTTRRNWRSPVSRGRRVTQVTAASSSSACDGVTLRSRVLQCDHGGPGVHGRVRIRMLFKTPA